jgi:sterol desaturase/sphingolipid hydroxylase (fatty acid hydroxylase superfamily)
MAGAAPTAAALGRIRTPPSGNVELLIEWERWLGRLVITPRMHGIHHSIVAEETGSNCSSGLTLWDWLHGTLRLNVPQQAITIGVPAYDDPQSEDLSHRLFDAPLVAHTVS